MGCNRLSERFRAKWMPVGVKKMLQNKSLEPGSDSVRTIRLQLFDSKQNWPLPLMSWKETCAYTPS
jgi:hypothetical protein